MQRIPLLVLLVAVLAVLAHVVVSLGFPYEIGYGESPILDQVSRLTRFESVYPASLAHPPFVVTNYPPLYHLVQLPFFAAVGPGYWYGRLISALSMVAVAVLIFLTLDALTRDRRAAAIGGLVFLIIPPVVRWAPLARVDFLALALSWLGLYLVVRRPPPRSALIAACVCFVASACTRQSYVVAAPLTALVWLIAQRRTRDGAVLALGSIAAISVVFLGLNLASSGGFALHVVAANQNAFSWERTGAFYARLGQQIPFFLIGTLAFVTLSGRREAALPLAVPYVLGAALAGLAVGKIGSDWNYFLELAAALALTTGLWAARIRTAGRGAMLFALALSLQVVATLWVMNGEIMAPRRQLLVGQRAPWDRLGAIVQSAEGPVLTDSGMGFLPLQGKPIHLQCFEMTQLSREGKWDETPLIRSIETQEFAVIVMNLTPQVLAERWTPRMLEAIAAHYQGVETITVGRRVDGVFRPRAARPPSVTAAAR